MSDIQKNIIQEELKNCPAIIFYPEINTLRISGRSIPENPYLVFRKLNDWLTLHFESNASLNLDLRLEYINSGSSKYLYESLRKISAYIDAGSEVRIKWFYESDDEGMLELGEHFRDTSGISLVIEKI